MSNAMLVTYATRQGSTQEVAEAIAETLREHRLEVDIQPVRNVRSLGGYRAVVLGAPFYMCRWHKDARHFLAHNRVALTERPIAIFALGPLHPDEKEFQAVRKQLEKERAKYPWLTVAASEIFGGKIDPAKLHFPFNRMPAGDIRGWTIIRAWASDLAEKLQPAPA